MCCICVSHIVLITFLIISDVWVFSIVFVVFSNTNGYARKSGLRLLGVYLLHIGNMEIFPPENMEICKNNSIFYLSHGEGMLNMKYLLLLLFTSYLMYFLSINNNVYLSTSIQCIFEIHWKLVYILIIFVWSSIMC